MKKILFILIICLICSISVFSQSKKKWEQTQSLNSITAYEDFIKKYPAGDYTELAKQAIEQLEFLNAKQANTLQAYENFMSKYEHSKFSEEAKASINELNIKKDWQEALNKNTIDGFEIYIRNHSEAKNIDEAKLNIEKLEWQITKSLNTISGYEQFITRFPQSTYFNEAKTNLETLDWKSTQTLGTVEALKSFINKYTESSHLKEAKSMLRDLTTPVLVKAASKNDMEQVKLLISKKEDVNSHSEGGPTALMYASVNNNLDMVKFLVSKGADINYRTKSQSAIYISDIGNYYSDSKSYNKDIVEYLVNTAIKLEGYRSPTIDEIRNLVWNEKEFMGYGRIEIYTIERSPDDKNKIIVNGEITSLGSSVRYEMGEWQLNITPNENKWKASVIRVK